MLLGKSNGGKTLTLSRQAGNAAGPVAAGASQVRQDDFPSASLQPFLDTCLGQVLAPLDETGFLRPELIVSLKAGYADAAASAAEGRQPAFLAAQQVCDAMASAVEERQRAVIALHGATLTHSSEIEQPRGGTALGQAEAQHKDAFFTTSQKTPGASAPTFSAKASWRSTCASVTANGRRR